tara:strand:+ start:2465 stop:3433 length:969 start_codon:yes stop_codon:yes gene_type:complete
MTILGNNIYHEEKIFKKELNNIFKNFHYVCDEAKIKNNNSFYSYILNDTPLVLRNHNNNTSCFSNICLHRSCLIHKLGFGNKKFMCNYHGWKYNENGNLISSPLIKKKINLKLKKFYTKNINGLIFCSLKKKIQMNLPNDISVGKIFNRNKIIHNANWKLLVENVLEGYHLSFVHKNTFSKINYMSSSKSKNYFYKFGSKSILFNSKNPNKNYTHYFIFPNLFFSIADDLIGYIGYFIPKSPTETVLHYANFETKNISKYSKKVKDIIKKEAINFAFKSIIEDKEVVELSQIGLTYSKNKHRLFDKEKRISHFYKIYKDNIN